MPKVSNADNKNHHVHKHLPTRKPSIQPTFASRTRNLHYRPSSQPPFRVTHTHVHLTTEPNITAQQPTGFPSDIGLHARPDSQHQSHACLNPHTPPNNKKKKGTGIAERRRTLSPLSRNREANDQQACSSGQTVHTRHGRSSFREAHRAVPCIRLNTRTRPPRPLSVARI